MKFSSLYFLRKYLIINVTHMYMYVFPHLCTTNRWRDTFDQPATSLKPCACDATHVLPPTLSQPSTHTHTHPHAHLKLTVPRKPFTGLDSISCSISFFLRISLEWLCTTTHDQHTPHHTPRQWSLTSYRYDLVGQYGCLHPICICMTILQKRKMR